MHLPTEQAMRDEAARLGITQSASEALTTQQRALVAKSLLQASTPRSGQPGGTPAGSPRLISRTSTPAFAGQLVVEVWHVPDNEENRT